MGATDDLVDSSIFIYSRNFYKCHPHHPFLLPILSFIFISLFCILACLGKDLGWIVEEKCSFLSHLAAFCKFLIYNLIHDSGSWMLSSPEQNQRSGSWWVWDKGEGGKELKQLGVAPFALSLNHRCWSYLLLIKREPRHSVSNSLPPRGL